MQIDKIQFTIKMFATNGFIRTD